MVTVMQLRTHNKNYNMHMYIYIFMCIYIYIYRGKIQISLCLCYSAFMHRTYVYICMHKHGIDIVWFESTALILHRICLNLPLHGRC